MILHNDINHFPLKAFRLCIVHKDYSGIVQEGDPSIEQLADAWALLYAQFVDLSENLDTEYLLGLQKEIELLNYRITLSAAALKLLSITHDERLVEILKAFRHQVKFLTLGNAKYEWNLRDIEATLANWQNRLELKEKELSDFSASKEGESISDDYFFNALIRLSRFMGYALKEDHLTTGEFLRMNKEYNSFHQKKHVTDGQ